jgi:hypothetical protein
VLPVVEPELELLCQRSLLRLSPLWSHDRKTQGPTRSS